VLLWDYHNITAGKVLSVRVTFCSDQRFDYLSVICVFQATQEVIPQEFEGVEHYISVIEPLLLEEFRASIQESQIEPGATKAHF